MRIIWLESAKQSPGVRCPSCRQIDGSASDANALPAFSPLQQTRALNYSRDGATLAPFAAKAGHDEEALVSVCPPPLGASSKVITENSEMQQDLFNFLEKKKLETTRQACLEEEEDKFLDYYATLFTKTNMKLNTFSQRHMLQVKMINS